MDELRFSARGTRIVAALAFLALAGVALRECLRLQALPGSDAVGAGAFPGIAAAAMGTAALVLVTGWRDTAEPFVIRHPRRVGGALLAMVAFVAGLGIAPVLAVITVFVAGFQYILGERRLPVLLAGTVLVPFGIWVMFGLLLNVPF